MSVRQYEEERQEREQNLKRENKRLREALEKISTRKMSCYLTVSAMNEDFIKIARKALEGGV